MLLAISLATAAQLAIRDIWLQVFHLVRSPSAIIRKIKNYFPPHVKWQFKVAPAGGDIKVILQLARLLNRGPCDPPCTPCAHTHRTLRADKAHRC